MRAVAGALLAGLMGAGCAAGGAGPAPAPAPQEDGAGYIPCRSPRPQVCTMSYQPVCGERGDGGRRTYSNGCKACMDPDVAGYRPGPCDSASTPPGYD